MKEHIETIFVVEDDIELSRSLSRALRKRGYAVEEFLSAEAFLAQFDPSRLGCLILDYGLPEMNGLELQAHLNEQSANVPVIFITGHGGVPESVQAMKSGAIDFLEKPYKTSDLVGKIELAFEVSRERDRNTRNREDRQRALDSLTQRETEVFNLLIGNPEKASSKAIARSLGISPRTADIHRSRVLAKTSCTSVAELVQRYLPRT